MTKRCKPTNPKDVAALDQVPMWALPAIGAIHGAMATGTLIDDRPRVAGGSTKLLREYRDASIKRRKKRAKGHARP